MNDFDLLISTPIHDEDIKNLRIGDRLLLSGHIYTGRDAVLPKICKMIAENKLDELTINLCGSVIFHTAVSPAGVGPTSSNKFEIENSFLPLSQVGVKMHLGKGKISQDTVNILNKYNAVYAVIPPVTALLKSLTKDQKIVAFPELGMEAMYELTVVNYPVIIAAARGESIY